MAELTLFAILAVLSNTALPFPFEPVLLLFAGGRDFAQASILAGVGSACAAVGALADLGVFGSLGGRWSARPGGRPMRRAGGWFYAAVFLVALLPIPFSAVRLALLRVRPRPALFAGVVCLARLPRYLVLVFLVTIASRNCPL